MNLALCQYKLQTFNRTGGTALMITYIKKVHSQVIFIFLLTVKEKIKMYLVVCLIHLDSGHMNKIWSK
ncbi:hypothetical protein AQUCO_01400259v1 [Aquilegia coerulea]|uniref:Uncharacterized protein n=1 Tax=Aquilegia coerulea TaxID=218851 RepID=A0A2G5DVF9_AQUCA|nr:hypothetical protein AQUCO_01400259v1 [Aquilegia coerulea]